MLKTSKKLVRNKRKSYRRPSRLKILKHRPYRNYEDLSPSDREFIDKYVNAWNNLESLNDYNVQLAKVNDPEEIWHAIWHQKNDLVNNILPELVVTRSINKETPYSEYSNTAIPQREDLVGTFDYLIPAIKQFTGTYNFSPDWLRERLKAWYPNE